MWLSFKKSKRKASKKPKKSRRKRSVKKVKRKSRRKSKRSRRSRRSRRSFGLAAKGPGYRGATSFQNGYAPYFGAPEPFINASEWFYPNPGSKGQMIGTAKTDYQSPNMIRMYKYGRRKY